MGIKLRLSGTLFKGFAIFVVKLKSVEVRTNSSNSKSSVCTKKRDAGISAFTISVQNPI